MMTMMMSRRMLPSELTLLLVLNILLFRAVFTHTELTSPHHPLLFCWFFEEISLLENATNAVYKVVNLPRRKKLFFMGFILDGLESISCVKRHFINDF